MVTKDPPGPRRAPVPAWDSVTDRERQILHLLLDRYSLDEVAKRLAISRTSVQRHVKHALTKLGPDAALRPARPAARLANETAVAARILPEGQLVIRCAQLAQSRGGRRSPWSVVALAFYPVPEPPALANLLGLMRATDSLGWFRNALVVVMPDTSLYGAERALLRLRPVLAGQGFTWGSAALQAEPGQSSRHTLGRAACQAERALMEAQARRSVGRPFPGD
jgi:DNA-binding CsgD family transcriptional regulator